MRRGVLGQSLVDFSTASWSSIQLQESAKLIASQQKRVQSKKTPRLLRSFAQSRVVADKQSMQQPLVPGMSQYSDDVDMDAGTADHPGNKKLSQEADVESVVAGFSDASSFFCEGLFDGLSHFPLSLSIACVGKKKKEEEEKHFWKEWQAGRRAPK